MRKQDVFRCIECNTQLPWRYKGRQRIYCSPNCRKIYTNKHPKKD